MLVKRLLLLPGKGDVIICIFILLNVLSGKPVSSVKVPCAGGSWPSTTYSSSPFSLFSLAIPSIYYHSVSLVFATNFHLISLQFLTSNAGAVLLPKDPIQKPVLNKTDPLLLTGGMREGRNASSYHPHNDYNKRRRTPVYNSSASVKSSSRNYSKINLDYAVVNVSFSNDGSGGGGPSANYSDQSSKLSIETSALAHSERSSSSGLINATELSEPSENKRPTGVRLRPRRKGRTRQVQEGRRLSNSSSVGGKRRTRKPKLLKEITLFNRQNCLAKLLCGVQVAQPPTRSSSALNDYAYLVKAFFDRFSIRGIVTDAIDAAFAYEQDTLDVLDDEADEDEEEDDTSSERRKKKRTKVAGLGGAAAHKPRTPAFEKYNPKYYEEYDKDVEDVDLEELLEDDMPDFMQPDIFRRRVGRNMTHVKPFKPPEECGENSKGNGTVDGGGKRRRKRSAIVPEDIDRIRRKRGIEGAVKRGFMGFFNPRFDKTAYLNKRQLELETSESQARQINIAEEIAARIRSPRQCRLLNWFGNNKNNENSQTSNNPNGMTTTITTITNTGGMIGNLERLNGIQNLPQAAVTGNGGGGGGPGSQVVTVIQQSPLGAGQNTAAPPTASSSSTMLNNMGQTASNAMSQASNVASSIGSTICPFNIQELQELILKAQNAPFPHFLTTTTPSPTRVVPAQLYQPVPAVQVATPPAFPASASTSTSTTTTTLKATQSPPPSTSTVAVVVSNPASSRHDPSAFIHLYGDFAPAPTPPSSHYHYNRYQHSPTEMYPSPIYPSPAYPTPFMSHQKGSRVQQQTRQPAIIPSVGTAGEDDEGEFDDDPYVIYEKHTDNHKNVQSFRRKPKPTPKWMTTTTPAPDDDFYSYNEAIPSYSYGTEQGQSGYKVTHPPPQKQTTEAMPTYIYGKPQNHGGYKVSHAAPQTEATPNYSYVKQHGHGGYEVTHLKSKKQSTEATPTVHTRQFHQPPEVFDGRTKYPPGSFHQVHKNSNKKTSPQGGGQNRPQQQKKKVSSASEEEEGSDEDTSGTSDSDDDEEEDDEEGSDEETSATSSGSEESRANLKQASPEPRKPPPVVSPQAEASEEEDGSNEAEEQSDGNNENEEDEEDGDSEEENNDGKRSYERNDFSKDRGGPPQTQTKASSVAKPFEDTNTISEDDTSSTSSGFFSKFFSSFGSFGSLFKKADKNKKNVQINDNKYSFPQPSPLPPRPLAYSDTSSLGSYQEDSDELDEDEDDIYESEETSYEPVQKSKPKPKNKISRPKSTSLPWPKPKQAPAPNQIEATHVPVIVEESSSWANQYEDPEPLFSSKKGYNSEEDDSGQEVLRENPVENYNVAIRRQNKNKKTLSTTVFYQGEHGKHKVDLNKYFSGLPTNSWLNEPIETKSSSKLKETSGGKKSTKDKIKPMMKESDEEDDDDDSTESEENDSLPRSQQPHPPPFIPAEPID